MHFYTEREDWILTYNETFWEQYSCNTLNVVYVENDNNLYLVCGGVVMMTNYSAFSVHMGM